MKSSVWTFIVVFIFSALALPAAMVKARADDKPLNVAAAQTDKQKRTNACRARYRDCVKLNQIPTVECQYVYQDCVNHIY
jgi:hypothetical protein